MAEPRKVPFVTISSFNTSPVVPTPQQESSKKRRREDEAAEVTCGKDGGGGGSVVGSGDGGVSGGAPFGNVTPTGGEGVTGEVKPSVRLLLPLAEPSDRASSEFNYGELVNSSQPQTQPQPQVKPQGSKVPKGLAPPLDPSDPFADDNRERREVEAMAKKFENKYGGVPKKKKKDRMQDLIDIGFGYDDTDPFIDNSEAYDELVPASLTTKHGGFYINTGTLQFRAASDSEGENGGTEDNRFKKMKDGEERVIKKRRKKQDGGILEEKKPRKNKVPKAGVSLNVHRPEKKKRKKLMKDSIHLANMLRRFTREKEEMRKKNFTAHALARANAKAPIVAVAVAVATGNSSTGLINAQAKVSGAADCNITDLTSDPAVMSLLGSTNNDILQDMMGDLDFEMLDSPQHSPLQGAENGAFGLKTAGGRGGQGVMAPPPLPSGLPAPLTKRIEDLRAASRLFDAEGRKKFFTLDMNNILLDIELQVQEQPAEVRSVVYCHLEAFVPCNKEALLKRLKKLSLNIQDDRLRTPLLKLKLAVCSVMPEQIARYNMDCIAKVAKQQSGEAEKNGSEDEDEEKPGKRVMGPRKKFVWDDKLRLLLCTLVRVKLGCYELEGKNSLSLEDYLKAFMETEVKPLWPKGWMQARMLFKESIMAHGHITGYTAKKKMVSTPKAKSKEAVWMQRSSPLVQTPAAQVAKRPPLSPSETICLDSSDDQLTVPSLDSISQALAILGNAAKGLAQGDSPPSPDRPSPTQTLSPTFKPSQLQLHASPILLQQHKKNSLSPALYISTSSPSTPLSRTPLSSPSTPLIRPLSVTSTPLTRPLSVTSAPLPSVRVDGMGVTHRLSVLNTSRTLPLPVGVSKANMVASASLPKPRPPPTSSPLIAPGSKPPPSQSPLLKGSNNKPGETIIITSPRPHTLISSPHMIPKTFQQSPRLPLSKPSLSLSKPSLSLSKPSLSLSKPSLSLSKLSTLPLSKPSTPLPQPQSNFITPMHATLTKSTHSSIVKLTARPTLVTTTSASPVISQTLPQRSQAAPPLHQYSAKTPFRSPQFSGVQVVKPGSYTPPGGQKTPNNSSSTTNTSLINASSISKHSGSSASPIIVSANQGQRQRLGGGTSQGAKQVVSVTSSSVSSQLPQVSTAGGGLLGSGSPLGLGFGMLGGLVPVSLPFQFPQLLNLPPLSSSSSSNSSNAANSAAFSTLTQNVTQSQGGDAKRKTL
ncbi:ubinuclein-2-like isoform X3 [Gymnodraco acuticeps]|uniref:Ubinuclein-2-like isoform X3 n=1 Tax=Gymnodraco acuticeps TaxID=8218 RepID=A0A6P8WNI2_GYMAC|nr:ubinuclein-2-like isoform X3 [Gymnodraco acuticeps]